ncbi:MAG TPA: Crp/Fnr family transcriptional regulator [Dissulfurispiraceae bacterium]|nr:Crp/Fnr family transcriptional regulator [Dissulfurispiraceae bacterium]
MQTSSTEEFLETFPVFRRNQLLAADILAHGQRRTVAKDQVIYSEGDTCSAIAFVLSGEIRVFKIGDAGREITLYEIEKGETCILNASCIISKMSYPAYAATALDTELLLIPAADFRRLVSRYEEMRDFVFGILSQRLAWVMALVEEITFERMDARLLEYLREKSEDGKLYSTHQKIANDLGTSREVVSRLLKHFERQKKVSLARNFIQLIVQ